MPITPVGSSSFEGTASAPSISYASSPGNLLIVAGTWYDSTGTTTGITSVADDSGSNTWQFATGDSQDPPAAHLLSGSGAGSYGVFIAWCEDAAAVSEVTVNLPASIYSDWVISEWPASSLAASLAASSVANGGNTDYTSPAITVPSGGGGLVMAFLNSFYGTIGVPAGATSLTGSSGYCVYEDVASAGAFSFVWPGFGDQDSSVAVAVFAPASGGTVSGAAALSGSGSLGAPAALAPAAALSGSGTMSAVPAGSGAAALAGSGTLTAGAVLTLAAAAALSGAGTLAAAAGAQPYGSPSGGPWVLVFADEFDDPDGTGKPDPSVWADHLIQGDYYRTNNGGNEVEWYPHDQRGLSVAGGILTLTARHEDPRVIDPLCPDPLPGGQTGAFTSGMVQSHPGFNFTYGYFEARIKLPPSAATGAWPAWWAYTSDDVWPPEIDIQDDSGGSGTWIASYWPPTGSEVSTGGLGGDGGADWHYLGCRRTADAITVYWDGVEKLNVTSADAELTDYAMHLVLNLAVNTGHWDGTGTGYPCGMQVDYVRAWTAAGVPGQPVITALSPADGVPADGTLEVTFDDGGGASSFRATPCPVDSYADGWTDGTRRTVTGTSSPLTLTGLQNGVRYAVTVAGINGTGYSIESLPQPPIPGNSLPAGAATLSGSGTLAAAPAALPPPPVSGYLSIAGVMDGTSVTVTTGITAFTVIRAAGPLTACVTVSEPQGGTP